MMRTGRPEEIRIIPEFRKLREGRESGIPEAPLYNRGLRSVPDPGQEIRNSERSTGRRRGERENSEVWNAHPLGAAAFRRFGAKPQLPSGMGVPA